MLEKQNNIVMSFDLLRAFNSGNINKNLDLLYMLIGEFLMKIKGDTIFLSQAR